MSPGRPPLIVRVDPEVKKRVERAAKKAKLTVPDWHRRALDRQSAAELGVEELEDA